MIEWYTIPGFTYYEINKSGQVRHRRHKRILKRGIPKNGYAQVHVRSDDRNKQVSKCIHHLMAITFMEDKPPGYELAFKDGDKTKIESTNLEYRLPKNNKNRIRKILTYCLLCGKVNPRANKKYCSKRHQFLYNHTLLQCCYCGNKFYRRNCTIKRNKASLKYTSGNVYCTGKCFHLSKKIKE